MKRKRNIIKRNSGFLVGCALAAGVSFATASVVMEQGVASLVMLPEEPESEQPKETAPPEKGENRVYETDAFTVTASGNIIKGVETEAPKKNETENQTETGPSGINGNQSGEDATGGSSQRPGGSSYGTDENSGSDSEENSSGSSTSGGSSFGGSGNGSSSNGSSGTAGESPSDWNYTGPSIVITDPGNGDYYYTDGSSWGGGSGSSSGGSSWGSSSGGSSGGSGSDGSSGEGSGGSDNIIVDNHPVTTPDDVILWGISSRYIDESELYNYNADELCLIRNEIFALHGRKFRMPELQEYFNGKSWYVPLYEPDDFDANMFDYLNEYERANLQVILDYEDALAGY